MFIRDYDSSGLDVAFAQLRLGNINVAEKAFNKRKGNFYAQLGLVRCHQDNGDFSRALQLIKKLIPFADRYTNCHKQFGVTLSCLLAKIREKKYHDIGEGYAFLQDFHYTKALAIFTQFDELDIPMQLLVARCYRDLGNFQRALDVLTKLYQTLPKIDIYRYKHDDIIFGMVSVYEAQRNQGQAFLWLDRIKDKNNLNFKIHDIRLQEFQVSAQAIHNEKDIQNILTSYEKLIEVYPTKWEIHLNYAMFLHKITDYQRSIAILTKLVDAKDFKPNKFEITKALHGISIAYFNLSNLSSAEYYAKKALQLFPTYAPAMSMLGKIYKETSSTFNEGKELLQQAYLSNKERSARLHPNQAAIKFNDTHLITKAPPEIIPSKSLLPHDLLKPPILGAADDFPPLPSSKKVKPVSPIKPKVSAEEEFPPLPSSAKEKLICQTAPTNAYKTALIKKPIVGQAALPPRVSLFGNTYKKNLRNLIAAIEEEKLRP